uniref:2-phosphosulfolactate phosphatase n=1 Tax=unclassified Rhodococcus (in: high G+C Gram-positive bacteria) TaxID=192944 RepID=UPI0015960A00|nr:MULTISPECIES: 2-phosphosulfolactate phosphatase [unclassified Rhodococcus (in: high G+C Gram-positive bacteria)]
MNSAHRQLSYDIRFEWGLSGAKAVAPECDLAVVVDVLSFTTTLSVALDAGITVLPFRVRGDEAQAYAQHNDAVLAVGRSVARGDQISLSSPTIRDRALPPERLVLPSPNGSTICYEFAEAVSCVVGGCLRNVDAIGQWVAAEFPDGARISVIAAGEKWPDGTLRPAVEDLWGAGALISAIAGHGRRRTLSPEARMAGAAWTAIEAELPAALEACSSGRELIDAGYPRDVSIAAELNGSHVVPVLRRDRFVPA